MTKNQQELPVQKDKLSSDHYYRNAEHCISDELRRGIAIRDNWMKMIAALLKRWDLTERMELIFILVSPKEEEL